MTTIKNRKAAAEKATTKGIIKEKDLSHIVLTADVGSFNVKLSSGLILENRFKLATKDDTLIGQDTITITKEIDGEQVKETYIQGRGAFDKNIIKAQKNYIVPLLFALAADGVSGEIPLIMHLPRNQMAMKEQVINSLQGKEFTFETTIDGVTSSRSIKFSKVGVLKEGFSSFYSLPKRNEGLIAIIDIGGRSTEIFTFINGKPSEEVTIPIGTMDYFERIADTLTGNGRITSVEEIKLLLDEKIIDIKDYEEITRQIFNRLVNESKQNFPNINEYQLKICGGGSEFFGDLYKEEYKKVEILKDNITSNVDGALELAKALGFGK